MGIDLLGMSAAASMHGNYDESDSSEDENNSDLAFSLIPKDAIKQQRALLQRLKNNGSAATHEDIFLTDEETNFIFTDGFTAIIKK